MDGSFTDSPESRGDAIAAAQRSRPADATAVALFRLRSAWALLVVVELVMLAMASLLAEREWVADVSSRKAGATVFILGAAGVTIVLFAGLLARRLLFAPNHEGAVALRSYVHGTAVLYLCSAAGVAMTLAMIVLTGRIMPLLLVAGLAIATQLVNFPAGAVLKRRGHRDA